MDQVLLYITIALIFFILLTLIFFKLLGHTSHYPTIQEYRSELYYIDCTTHKECLFSSIKDPPSCSLSVIIPAYNEEKRLPPMLDDAVEHLERRSKKDRFTYEIILVDDGSRDFTTNVAMKYSEKLGSEKMKVLTLAKNRGKGGAVRLGMMRARGEILLFVDADGATKFSDFDKVEEALLGFNRERQNVAECLGIVCGSRSHLEKEAVAQRSLFRTILMYGFHFVVWLFAVKGIKDTQCGFKLLTRRSARIVFRSLHIEKWAFDVEMLFIAQTLGIPIAEIPVNWKEIDGSKVTPIFSWIQMGRDLVLIWLRYTLGIWRIKGDFSH